MKLKAKKNIYYISVLIILVGLLGPVVKINAAILGTCVITPTSTGFPQTTVNMSEADCQNFLNGVVGGGTKVWTPSGGSSESGGSSQPVVGNYQPLSPLPGTTVGVCDPNITNPPDPNCETTLSTYIPGLFKLLIALAGALAIIMIVIGGVQYLSTDAISGKSEGKERIENAIIGLLLAIGSYIILNTINPGILTLNLGLKVPPKPAPSAVATKAGTPWPSDSIERTTLKNELGINAVNKENCTTIGQSNCTSVYNMNDVVLYGLDALKKACGLCEVVVTGGTEYWLHGNRSTDLNTNTTTSHRPGGLVVDLRLTIGDSLHTWLKTKGKKIDAGDPLSNPRCAPGLERYTAVGALFVNEEIPGNPTHWHVCFGI
jgi:hypothetical protein